MPPSVVVPRATSLPFSSSMVMVVEVWEQNGKLIRTVTTDETGVATIEQLDPGGMSSLVSTDVNSELAVNSLNPEG